MPVFLFSDIEGSTTRWETAPDAMSEAVRQHDEMLHEAVRKHGGRVFKTVGDAFCVVFDSAEDAVAAAVAAQRELATLDWSQVGGLHVRMAVHAGEVVERDGDYFGQPVNRVARLLATAHGGQVVVSGTVADALRDSAPAGTSLRALGTFRLKDLERAERIYQVAAPGLANQFKPLTTLDAIPNNLPVQSSAFVGRESDIAKIRDILRTSSVMTIAGPGGVGKTRIALQCAADRMDRMTDGVWFVNLAPLSDPSLISSTILSAIGASTSEAGDALTTLVEYLKPRTTLLILDNCEHVVQEAARCAARIHEQCPHVTIVATSREALRVPDEHIYRLNPLKTPEAASLFVARAQAASPRFELTAENRPYVETICMHLDGIPLAIELAAARTHALTPKQLAERIDQRFRLLTGGGRTALPRQQTLQALIDWSHDLLDDSEKVLFRRLSVFRGSFTLESASAVCADDILDELTIVDLLTSLADKSLVVAELQEAQPRYYLLESIREYAWSKLQREGLEHPRYHLLESIREYASVKLHEAREAEQLQLCHAEFFGAKASVAYEQFDAHPPDNWLTELSADLDNFRTALNWSLSIEEVRHVGVQMAADIAPMFLRLSLLNEGVAWCTRAEKHADGCEPEARGRLEYVLSMLYNNQGAYASALESAVEAVKEYRRGSDQRGLSRALSQAARLHAKAGRLDLARPLLDEAVTLAKATKDLRLIGSVLRRCAFALPPEEIQVARRQFTEAIEIATSVGDVSETCLIRQWWAQSEAAAGFYENAFDIAVKALECADRDSRMYLCSDIAGYGSALGSFERAQPFAREALSLALEARHTLLIAIAIAYSSWALSRQDPTRAVMLSGYAKARLSDLQWTGDRTDQAAFFRIEDYHRKQTGADYDNLVALGSALPHQDALDWIGRINILEHRTAGALTDS